MAAVRFETTLQDPEATGVATFIEIPLDVRAIFGRARPPVLVTMNGYTYRSTVAVYGGRSYLPVNAVNRAGAGVKPGDTVTVDMETDTGERRVEIPADLATALSEAQGALERFSALAYTRRSEYVRWVTEAKRPETRQRRVAETVSQVLSGTIRR